MHLTTGAELRADLHASQASREVFNPSHRASSASWALADEPSTVGLDLEGRIHHARGCAVAACHLAKLLRHHRLCCGDVDGLDVRGGDLDGGGAGASAVVE